MQELDPARRRRAYDLRVARTALIVTGVVVGAGIGLALLWRLRVIVLLVLVSLFIERAPASSRVLRRAPRGVPGARQPPSSSSSRRW